MADQNKDIDLAKLALDLHGILSAVTVSGPQNIHNMDLVLNGLIVLHNKLAEEKKQQAETSREEI